MFVVNVSSTNVICFCCSFQQLFGAIGVVYVFFRDIVFYSLVMHSISSLFSGVFYRQLTYSFFTKTLILLFMNTV